MSGVVIEAVDNNGPVDKNFHALNNKFNLGLDNTDIAANAGITYAKLKLALSIVNADVATNAAIAYGKLNLLNSLIDSDVYSAANIAFSKLEHVAWTTYTPTWTSGGGSVGSGGVLTGKYQQVDRIVVFYVDLTFGTGLNAGSGSTSYLFTTPTGIAGPGAPTIVGGCNIVAHGSNYTGATTTNNSTTVKANFYATTGTSLRYVGLSPVNSDGVDGAFVANDYVRLIGVYESST